MLDIYSGKKVLITGITGFKGSWLASWLIELGAEVYGLSRKLSNTTIFFDDLKLERKINVGGIPEQMDPDTGSLFDIHDPIDLTGKLEEALDDLTRSREKGNNAAKYVSNNFSMDRCFANYNKLYRELMGETL